MMEDSCQICRYIEHKERGILLNCIKLDIDVYPWSYCPHYTKDLRYGR